MKLYNISNTDTFFKKLAACRGEVEFVDEKNGNRTFLPRQGIRESLLPISLIHGEIREIELIFHDQQDSETMFRFALNRGRIAS